VRLIRCINEQKNDLEWIDIIAKDCKQSISEMRQAKALLWRGMRATVDNFKRHKTRKNRRPLDTTPDMHKLADKIMKDKFGWQARSQGLICSNGYDTAGEYGSARAIFPVGNYKCVWAPGVSDFREISPYWAENFEKYPKGAISDYMRFSHHRGKYGDIDLHADLDIQIEQLEKIIERMIKDSIQKFKQTGLYEPLSHSRDLEIMVKCKEYYSVTRRSLGLLAGQLDIEWNN